MVPEFPGTSSQPRSPKWSPSPSTEPWTWTTSTCTKKSSTGNVRILTAARSEEHSSFPTNTPITLPSKIFTAVVTRSQYSLWPTKTTRNIGPREPTTTGWRRWLEPDSLSNASQTSLMVPLSEWGLRISAWAVTSSSRWWLTNSSSMTPLLPPRWVVCLSGRIRCTSECRTNATETVETVHQDRILSGKWWWTNWTEETTPLSTSLYLAVTWWTLARTFRLANSSPGSSGTTSTGTSTPTGRHLAFTSTPRGWRARRSTERNWSNSSRRCWPGATCISLPWFKWVDFGVWGSV